MYVENIKNLTELNDKFRNHKVVVVMCSAEWCGPCQQMTPVFHNIAINDKYAQYGFFKADIDEANDLSDKYAVESIPTYLIFSNGELCDRMHGTNAVKLQELLDKYV